MPSTRDKLVADATKKVTSNLETIRRKREDLSFMKENGGVFDSEHVGGFDKQWKEELAKAVVAAKDGIAILEKHGAPNAEQMKTDLKAATKSLTIVDNAAGQWVQAQPPSRRV